ncbi:ribonuclease domain-containing protein [Rhodococcus sp. NPDC003322]
MTRLGPRARLVLGVLVAVLAVVAGFLLAGPGGQTGPDAELVRSHAGDPSIATVTATQQGLTRDEVQRLTVDEDGTLVALPSTAPATAAAAAQTAGPRGVVPVPVPDVAWATLAEIDAGRWPGSANAPGTKGGDTWRNREGTLPRTDTAGSSIAYREWDVNPKRRGESRDAERIVTGSDTSAWYTGDHYESFTRMR